MLSHLASPIMYIFISIHPSVHRSFLPSFRFLWVFFGGGRGRVLTIDQPDIELIACLLSLSWTKDICNYTWLQLSFLYICIMFDIVEVICVLHFISRPFLAFYIIKFIKILLTVYCFIQESFPGTQCLSIQRIYIILKCIFIYYYFVVVLLSPNFDFYQVNTVTNGFSQLRASFRTEWAGFHS